MSAKPKAPIQPDWISKTLAGVLLGFALCIAVSGLFAWLTPGGPAAPQKSQATMWITMPVWGAVLSFVYLFRSGAQAWRWLGGATVLAYALLAACRHFLQ